MPQRKRQHVDCHELRALVEQAPDAYFLHDFNGHIIDVNRCTCESLGYSREELLELSVFDIEMDFDHAAAQVAWSAMVPGHGSTLAGQHRRQDGTVFPIEARVSVCVFGGERLYLVLARDLTDRKTAEEALRVSAEHYKTLFESIDEGFCVVQVLFDAEGHPDDYRFLEVNPAFEKHVGIMNAAGRTIRELVPGIERKWIEIYGRVALTGQSVRFREFSPSLHARSFDVYAFRFGAGGSARVAILFANVTERVLGEEALKKSERLALIGRMAGVLSHEILNPLAAVQGLLYLAEFGDDPVTALDYIRKAQHEVSSAAHIASHTLNFTRQMADPAREKLSTILDSALTLLDGKRRQARVLVVRDYQAEAEVLCISSEVRQVFANILANAFDATPCNGTVTVRVRNSSHFTSSEAGVRVTIADTGCGMTLATQKQLFQAFYSTKGRNGTGLGLWISQEILARHGVTTRVRSRQGASRNGTVFVLCFPRDTGPRSLEAVQSEVQAELMRDIHRDGQLLHHDPAYQSSS